MKNLIIIIEVSAIPLGIAGFMRSLVSASWLVPRWYTERYPETLHSD